jgi:hypothetical protein
VITTVPRIVAMSRIMQSLFLALIYPGRMH